MAYNYGSLIWRSWASIMGAGLFVDGSQLRPRYWSVVLLFFTLMVGSSSGCVQVQSTLHSHPWDREFRVDSQPGREDGSRSLGAAGRAPSELTVLHPSLFVNITARAVLAHTPQPPFDRSTAGNGSSWCGSMVRNIVFLPNTTRFYYILEERCTVQGIIAQSRLSFRKADPIDVIEGRQSVLKESIVVSYGWAVHSLDGEAPTSSSPAVFESNQSSSTLAMAEGMDLSPDGSHLLLGLSSANLTLLSTSDGSRTSIPVAADKISTLALNPTKTELYMVDNYKPARLLSLSIGPSGFPIDGMNVETIAVFDSRSGEPDASQVAIGTQTTSLSDSHSADGCVLLWDRPSDRIWRVESALWTESSSSRPTVLAGTPSPDNGNLTDVGGDGLNVSFAGLRDMAMTSDGCNVFVLEVSGYLSWVQVDSPCGKAQRVETVARSSTKGFWGLALLELNDRLHLYIGTDDGHLLELEIDKSQLHTCVLPAAIPPSKSTPISSSPPLTDSATAVVVNGSDDPPRRTPGASPAAVSGESVPPLRSEPSISCSGCRRVPLKVMIPVVTLCGIVLMSFLYGLCLVTRVRRRERVEAQVAEQGPWVDNSDSGRPRAWSCSKDSPASPIVFNRRLPGAFSPLYAGRPQRFTAVLPPSLPPGPPPLTPTPPGPCPTDYP